MEVAFIRRRQAASLQKTSEHAENCINIPLKYLAAWAGWLVDYDAPICLVSPPDDLSEVTRILHKIGIEGILGYFDSSELSAAGAMSQTYVEKTASVIAPQVDANEVILIDVRSDSEWKDEHIPGAKDQPHAGISNTSFYIIEDAWADLAARTLDFIAATTD